MPGSRRLTAGALALLHDPDRHTRPFFRRHDSALPFDPAAPPADLPPMLDPTVYVHRLQNKIPAQIHVLVEARTVLHCAVAVAEIAISAGIMDPTHATTGRYRTPLPGLLHGISVLDMRAPGPAAWAEAGMLAGILARTQFGLAQPQTTLGSDAAEQQRESRRRPLNDALIFLCAGEHGAVLVSGNVADIDVPLRFRPDIQVLLYRVNDQAMTYRPTASSKRASCIPEIVRVVMAMDVLHHLDRHPDKTRRFPGVDATLPHSDDRGAREHVRRHPGKLGPRRGRSTRSQVRPRIARERAPVCSAGVTNSRR